MNIRSRKLNYKEFVEKYVHPQDTLWTVVLIEPISTRISYLLYKLGGVDPNLITMVRIAVFYPISILMFLLSEGTDKMFLLTGAVSFYLGFLTDNIDGHLARALNKASRLGDILDKASDRAYPAILLSVFLSFHKIFFLLVLVGIFYVFVRCLRKESLLTLLRSSTSLREEETKSTSTLAITAPLWAKKLFPRVNSFFINSQTPYIFSLLLLPILYVTGIINIVTYTYSQLVIASFLLVLELYFMCKLISGLLTTEKQHI